MEQALVTGVAGFIGSHIAEQLLAKNYKVIGIDCFTDYYSKKLKEKNLINCLKNKNFSFLERDIINLDLIPIFNQCQYLFHESAQPGVRKSWGENFQTYVKENILVTQKILECAKQTNSFKKIVLASSSSVYGNQNGILTEDITLPKPSSPYGVTKLASENLGQTYYQNFGLPIVSLRYFTVYGPRQRPDMAFNKFLKSTLMNEKIIVYGDGNQTRDFTYVDDIVNANIFSAQNSLEGEIINIGGGNTVSINDVLKMLSNILNSELKIDYLDEQKGDVRHTEASTLKAFKLINFKPEMDLEQGLKNEADYIKQNLNLYS